MDILYPLKPIPSKDLTYSIRSLAENYPHDKIFVSGGYPANLKDFVYIHNNQNQNKWKNTGNNIRTACQWDLLSDDFILFNDDFYILKPVSEPKNYYSGTLLDKIQKHPKNRYRLKLQRAYDYLVSIGINEPKNYELHVPMIMNKHKLLELPYVTRSVYGNIYITDAEELPNDVKLYDAEKEVPDDWTYLSISDKYYQSRNFDKIRYKFSKKCRYEQ